MIFMMTWLEYLLYLVRTIGPGLKPDEWTYAGLSLIVKKAVHVCLLSLFHPQAAQLGIQILLLSQNTVRDP